LIQILSYINFEVSDDFERFFSQKQSLYEVKTKAKSEMKGLV
jgi:hypothetical protein